MAKNGGSILVTGGAGFIGSHVVPRLLQRGYSVTILDDLSSGSKENLSQVLSDKKLKFIQGDIRDPQAVKEGLNGADAIVHLAAQIDVAASVANPTLTHEINVTGTLNVLRVAASLDVRRIVFASSTAVYGDPEQLPVTEQTLLKPLSPYAASKVAGEAYCTAFGFSFNDEPFILRLFNVYGPKNEGSPYSGVITKFLQQALAGETLIVEGDGEQTRDFIHVSDVAEAFVLAAETNGIGRKAFNICTGKATSVNDLVECLGKVFGRKLPSDRGPSRRGDVRFSYGDGSEAAGKLGFKARVGMNEGLKLLYEATTARK